MHSGPTSILLFLMLLTGFLGNLLLFLCFHLFFFFATHTAFLSSFSGAPLILCIFLSSIQEFHMFCSMLQGILYSLTAALKESSVSCRSLI